MVDAEPGTWRRYAYSMIVWLDFLEAIGVAWDRAGWRAPSRQGGAGFGMARWEMSLPTIAVGDDVTQDVSGVDAPVSAVAQLCGGDLGLPSVSRPQCLTSRGAWW
ncbi:hypothetical protein [Streptomyces atratus]|uniref:hypothetical protein n=1 Tax=Streptomyces atratus TaxID=1893 RepID=UPI0033FC4EF4